MARASIDLNYDRETGAYYACWGLTAIGAGKTKKEALEDLRAAVHFGVDTLIDQKLDKIIKKH